MGVRVSEMIKPAGYFLVFLALLFAPLGLCSSISQEQEPLSIRLTVSNRLDIPRRHEPVTSGIPLPADSNITEKENLRVTRADGTDVPAQFRVLARWGRLSDEKRPIKWVLADFNADMAAGADAVYYLKTGRGSSVPGIEVEETGQEIKINTGAMAFAVSKKSFGLINRLVLSGGTDSLVTGGDNAGIQIDKDSVIYSSLYDLPTVTIEERGPLRTVLLIRGKFKSKGGKTLIGGDGRVPPNKEGRPAAMNYPLEYTVRIHSYYGKSYLRLYYTLENNGNGQIQYDPINDVFFDENRVKVQTDLKSPVKATTGRFSAELDRGDTFDIFQGHKLIKKNDESKNFYSEVHRNGVQVSEGKRSEGWLDISDKEHGMALGMRYFWQNYPKELTWNNGSLQLAVLPAHNMKLRKGRYGSGNHYFSGGWHKTTELFLYFHHGDAKKAGAEEVLSRLDSPLFAQCDKTWYANSEAWGLIAPSQSLKADSKRLDDAFDRYEEFQEMFVNPDIDKDIVALREMRNLSKNHYGWQNFGDFAWKWNGEAAPYCALHYDWPYIMWLQFMRSGDARFLDRAYELTEHSVDMDQVRRSDRARENGLWWWEEQDGGDAPHKSYNGSGLIVSHTWNGGYALGYLLTGDYRYFEAAKRGAQAGRAFWSTSPHTNAIGGRKVEWDQTRSQGWSILMLVNLYRITGNESLLKDALKIFENSLLYTEQLPRAPGSGGKGYISYTGAYLKEKLYGTVIVTFGTYALEPLCELHYEADRAGLDVKEIEAYLIRSLNWLKDYAYVGGQYDSKGKYSFLTLSYATDPNDPEKNPGGELAHNMHVAGAFGYGYSMLKEKNPDMAIQYLNFARNLFRDLILYRTEEKRGRTDYHDPGRYSPVNWGWMPTATKEMAWIGRGGQFYLHAEWKIAGADHK